MESFRVVSIVMNKHGRPRGQAPETSVANGGQGGRRKPSSGTGASEEIVPPRIRRCLHHFLGRRWFCAFVWNSRCAAPLCNGRDTPTNILLGSEGRASVCKMVSLASEWLKMRDCHVPLIMIASASVAAACRQIYPKWKFRDNAARSRDTSPLLSGPHVVQNGPPKRG